MSKVYVLSHTDPDGYFSAGLVEFFHKRLIDSQTTFKHKSWTYGRELPNINTIKKNYDYVYIVDLCPDNDFMAELYEHFGYAGLVWIDHHCTPDKAFLEFAKTKAIPGIRGKLCLEEHSKSAALLTWEYFVENCTLQKEPFRFIPNWLYTLSDYDAWHIKSPEFWQNEVLPFFTYIKTQVSSPKDALDFLEKLEDFATSGYKVPMPADGINCEYFYRSCVDKGKHMFEFLRTLYDNEAKHGFERILTVRHGYSEEERTIKAWVCNTQNRSSVIFETMPNVDDYDVFIPYHFNGEKYFYSMYTFKEDISCDSIKILSADKSDIVLEFHGHKDASGANSINFAFA